MFFDRGEPLFQSFWHVGGETKTRFVHILPLLGMYVRAYQRVRVLAHAWGGQVGPYYVQLTVGVQRQGNENTSAKTAYR